jgi:uncharacterized protein
LFLLYAAINQTLIATNMKKILVSLTVLSLTIATNAQVLLSGGITYSQNFDSLSNTPAGTTYTWTDNTTPGVEGWYASRAYVSGTTSAYGPFAYPTYRVGDGSANNGAVWSLGTIGATDRALGSISSGTPKTNAFGLRILNASASAIDNFLISYTGEQWRNGGNTAIQTLGFSYKISSTAFTSPLDVVLPGVNGWVGFSALDFNSPITGATAATLDGNLAANRTVFSNVLLSGVTLNPGEELFLRWLDPDDSGNDHGFGVDDFSVSASNVVPEPATAALGALAALGLLFWRRNRR